MKTKIKLTKTTTLDLIFQSIKDYAAYEFGDNWSKMTSEGQDIWAIFLIPIVFNKIVFDSK